jgi:hypothetical protein
MRSMRFHVRRFIFRNRERLLVSTLELLNQQHGSPLRFVRENQSQRIERMERVMRRKYLEDVISDRSFFKVCA